MPEIFRTRDVIVFAKTHAIPVAVSTTLKTGGWTGGQGVQWADVPGVDQFLVTYSDGPYGGFLLWGSDEPADQYVSYVENQPTYGFAVLCTGNWLIATSTFERYTYASRTGGGPLVPLVYAPGDALRFSLRGFFTKEDEWTLSADPRAPNRYIVGRVAQPNTLNPTFLSVQTIL
jgi:hypothetical protein